MRRLPQVLFIIDTKKEHIAIHESERLDIPVVALVDTNSDPEEITYPIPANDDAIRAVRLLSGKIADAALEGAQEYASTVAKEEAEEGFEPSAYEGYIFEPEGYEASLDENGEAVREDVEAVETDDETEGESDVVAVESAEAPEAELPKNDLTAVESEAEVSPEVQTREEDAAAGEAPPVAQEAAEGVQPDAAK